MPIDLLASWPGSSGAFEVHEHDRERGHPFLERIWEAASDVHEMSKKYGRRNIALTTTAPAGSVSTLTQTTSGIEPAYLLKYTRRKKLTENDLDGRVTSLMIQEIGGKSMKSTTTDLKNGWILQAYPILKNLLITMLLQMTLTG